MNTATLYEMLGVIGMLVGAVLVVTVGALLMHCARRWADRGWPSSHREWR